VNKDAPGASVPRKLALMRSRTVSLMVTVALAAAPAAAAAQAPEISGASADLPPSLFDPAPDSLPPRTAAGDDTGAPLLLAGVLLAGAAAAGYLTGSLRRTRMS
jgi:hypothetical protein